MRSLVSSALYPESQAMIQIKVPLLPSKQKESFFSPLKFQVKKKSCKLHMCKNTIRKKKKTPKFSKIKRWS